MLALFTSQMIFQVDDEEHAGEMAMKYQNAVRDAMNETLLEHGLSPDDPDVQEFGAFLGVSVSVVPETVRAG